MKLAVGITRIEILSSDVKDLAVIGIGASSALVESGQMLISQIASPEPQESPKEWRFDLPGFLAVPPFEIESLARSAWLVLFCESADRPAVVEALDSIHPSSIMAELPRALCIGHPMADEILRDQATEALIVRGVRLYEPGIDLRYSGGALKLDA